MKVLITGGAGFIGRHLVEFLNDKGVIPFIYDPELWYKHKFDLIRNFKFISLNKQQVDSLNCRDFCLVNLGSDSSTRIKITTDLYNNVEKQIDILDRPWEKIVHASSASIYGNRDDGEEDPLNDYARMKLMIEHWFLANADYQKCSRIFNLRLFNVYGIENEMKGEMNSVLSKAFYQNKIQLFDESDKIKRDFVYVGDVCEVIYQILFVTCMRNGDRLFFFDIGTGESISFLEAVKIINPNIDIEFIPFPDFLIGKYQNGTVANNSEICNLNGLTSLNSFVGDFKFRSVKEIVDAKNN